MKSPEKELTLQNDHLRLSFLPHMDPPLNCRFDSAANIVELVYRDRHTFCVPEQHRPWRKTTNGVGLCSEMFLDDTDSLAKPGEYFPKPGVGLLLQLPEGGAYNRWNRYQVIPFPVEVSIGRERAVFRQEMLPCLGFAGSIEREVYLAEERLHIVTTVLNTGEKEMRLREYQHNFVSVDNLPVGPGYELEVPFDGGIGNLKGSLTFSDKGGVHPDPESVVSAEGQALRWKQPMEGLDFCKVTPAEQIIPCDRYYWKLSSRDAGAWIRETMCFTPTRVIIWAIEHCVCTEVYINPTIPVGESRSWERIWDFGEE